MRYIDDMRKTVRSCLVFAAVVLSISKGGAISSDESESKEYCLDEEYDAECMKNEIIVMKSALFGRMKTGRCIPDSTDAMFTRNKIDPKFLGCYLDVLKLMDDKCTGNQSCKVKISNEIKHQVVENPCYSWLGGYLEASYACIAVVVPDRICTVSVTSSAQHLMTSHSSTQSCGSRHQPWKLEAPAGQQINVSLLDFGGAVNQRDGECLQYGYIVDREANRNVSICGLVQGRSEIVYLSQSSSLEIVLKGSDVIGVKFFLRIVATGCTDLVPPEGSWLRRRGNAAVVGCYSSRQSWHLNCVNKQWLGVIGNCTIELVSEVKGEEITNKHTINNEVLVTLMIAVCGLIVCIVIIVCGAVCIKRYSTTKNYHKYEYNCQKDVFPAEYRHQPTLASQHHQSM